MRSTFMGLETNKSGLFLQQTALYTTGHNIANANTAGYSRQRVNMQALPGFPSPGLNSPKLPGHLGTGAEAHSIQRIRDQFIDRQFRQETNNLGYWDAQSKSIKQMEDVMTEPSEFGINQSFTDFWKSMQDIVSNPKNTAARQVMLSKGQALAESFNYVDTQLKKIQGNIGNEINVTTSEINSILKQIAAINKQIQKVEPNGYVTNDLYDARDVLVDKLNTYIPITTDQVKTGGNASEVAEGTLTIYYNGVELVKGKDYAQLSTLDANNNPVDGNVDDPATNGYTEFGKITISDLGEPPGNTIAKEIAYADMDKGKGKLKSLIDAYGHSGSQGLYPEMLSKLDTLVLEFVNAFNNVHQGGFGLDGSTGVDFFTGTTAKDITVAIKDPKQIAASDVNGEEGNNKNILLLAKLQSDVQAGLNGGTFQSYYESVVGELGVLGQEAIREAYNSGTLRLSIENERASVSSVSLDEEMSNMIMFQQAYNANARMITVVDETLDKLINGMGRVGL